MAYQHLVPQRAQDHDVVPRQPVSPSGVLKCATCARRIKPVADNDGPEGLKALLRF